MYYNPLTDVLSELPTEHALFIGEEERTGVNTSFVKNTEVQFAFDSVSLNSLKTCPRKYFYEIIQGYEMKIRPATLGFGIAFHTCMEQWHKLLAFNVPKEDAILRITRLAGLLGETVTGGDPVRTKETLMRTVCWYLFQFWDDPARTTTLTTGKPAVEFSFTFPLEIIDGVQTYLCGHIDRIVVFQGELFITDYKTTKAALDHRYFEQYKPNGQLKGYLLAAHVLASEGTAVPETPAGALIEAAQLGVNFSRYMRFPVMYSIADIEEYAGNTIEWIKLAHMFADKGNWPMNESSCDKYGGCTFREICRQSPAFRQRHLETAFRQRTWDPLRSR